MRMSVFPVFLFVWLFEPDGFCDASNDLDDDFGPQWGCAYHCGEGHLVVET